MADFRFVQYVDPRTFVEATDQCNDYLVKNCGALSVADFEREPSDPTRAFFLAVYHRDDLLLTFVHGTREGFPWTLSTPRRADDLLTSELLMAAVEFLAKSLITLEIADPALLDPMRIFGVEKLVEAFLAAWIALQNSRGNHIRLYDAHAVVFVTYATRDTLISHQHPRRSLTSTSPKHVITRAAASDVEDLIPFFMDFFTHYAYPMHCTRDEAISRLEREIPTGLTWICRTDGILTAFAELGRVSPRTITIRSVYVPPEFRRRGIASALIIAISRYYLGMKNTTEGVPEGPPLEAVKDQVNLNVSDAPVERMYHKLGFLLPNDMEDSEDPAGIDPATGRRGWYRAVLRQVEPDPDDSDFYLW